MNLSAFNWCGKMIAAAGELVKFPWPVAIEQWSIIRVRDGHFQSIAAGFSFWRDWDISMNNHDRQWKIARPACVQLNLLWNMLYRMKGLIAPEERNIAEKYSLLLWNGRTDSNWNTAAFHLCLYGIFNGFRFNYWIFFLSVLLIFACEFCIKVLKY